MIFSIILLILGIIINGLGCYLDLNNDFDFKFGNVTFSKPLLYNVGIVLILLSIFMLHK